MNFGAKFLPRAAGSPTRLNLIPLITYNFFIFRFEISTVPENDSSGNFFDSSDNNYGNASRSRSRSRSRSNPNPDRYFNRNSPSRQERSVEKFGR